MPPIQLVLDCFNDGSGAGLGQAAGEAGGVAKRARLSTAPKRSVEVGKQRVYFHRLKLVGRGLQIVLLLKEKVEYYAKG